MIESDRYWPALCRALEREDWIADPRFDSAVTRLRNNAELVALLDGLFRARTLAEWEKRFADFELIWSPMRRMSEIFDDPQIRAMGYWRSVDHPSAGRFETMGPPFDLSATPLAADRPAPALGADGEAVLREAGLGEAEIRAALATRD
jgi:CoA:oxalate CoA-transferase